LTALYQDALGRPVDPTGKATFGNALAKGASRGQIAAAIFDSSEYQHDLLENAYGELLLRPADSTGLASFTAGLRQGTHDDAILAAIAGSAEYFQRL
jgi:hypothetical protein